MQSCPMMAAVITAIATKHNIDLQQNGAHLRLDMPGHDRLCIERIGSHRISVAHYFETNGDLVAEPDVEFFVTFIGEWFPIAITQSLTGWQACAELDDIGTVILRYQPQRQRDLAVFVEQWATNLEEQGWLEEGRVFIRQHSAQKED